MYLELHCHSCFSLLDGTAQPEALVARAVELEMPALALTDHDALYGVVPFWRAAGQAGIKPVLGVEMTVGEGTHLTLLAENATGFAHLSQLVTAARLGSSKGKALATWDDLARYSTGLLALSGCRRGLVAQALLAGDEAQAQRAAQDLQALFGRDRFWIEVQRQLRPGDERLAQGLLRLAGRIGAPVVATNDVHYARRTGHRLHDVLVAIRSHTTLDASYAQRRGNSEAHLKGTVEMARLFADCPDALRQTLEIAQRCNVSLQRSVQDLPRFPTGSALPDEHLRALCCQALAGRYGAAAGERAQRLLEHELAVIQQLGLANYFLIVWDIVYFARQQGIRCQGRGSAANSLVAFLLGITPIDPLAHDLVFERFLSVERPTLPDIDIDFQADRREEVIQYIYSRYGREHAAMACTFVTYRQRSAVRDVAKALDFPLDLIDALAEASDRRGLEEAWREVWDGGEGERGRGREGERERGREGERERGREGERERGREGKNGEGGRGGGGEKEGGKVDRRTWQLLLGLCEEIQRLPRHLGIHNGGFVLSRRPLAEIVPLEPATMAGRTVVQWDKEALEDAGLVKIDVLGLRILGALEEALGWVEEEGRQGDKETSRQGDEETSRQGDKGEGRQGDKETSRQVGEAEGRWVDWGIGVPRRRVGWEGFDDPAVYAMLAAGDTVGVFQVESRAQAQLLPRLRPQNFADLMVEISLIRPGPVQAGMVHPYLRRRLRSTPEGAARSGLGQEPVSYLHPSLEPALRDTLGVVVFQEQVLKVAQALAGWSGGQGELLRRTLGRKDNQEALMGLRQRFVADASARGAPAAVADQVFGQLEAFGSYSFAKSHAAAFAVIVYQSAWLKRYHPVPFYVALLNHQPMGFWSPAVLLNDARRHGIAILPASVAVSAVNYMPEGRGTPALAPDEVLRSVASAQPPGDRSAGASIRIGLATVQGLGLSGAERIVAARGAQPFASLLDFCRRTRLPRRLVENLIVAGALGGGGEGERGREGEGERGREGEGERGREGERRALLWQLGLLDYEEETLLGGQEPEPAPLELPPLTPLEAMAGELRVMGVSAGPQVMAYHRQRMQQAGVLSSRELAAVPCHEGMSVWVAGQVTVVQAPPTAKGFMFVTLEDEFGMINVIVAPDVVARYRRVWRHSPLLAVLGRVQRQGPVINLLAVRPWPMADLQAAHG